MYKIAITFIHTTPISCNLHSVLSSLIVEMHEERKLDMFSCFSEPARKGEGKGLKTESASLSLKYQKGFKR